MIDLPTYDSILSALDQPLDPELRSLLARRTKATIANALGHLTHILVVQPGDTEADIADAIGFSPLVSRIDGVRGQPDYDWIDRHHGWTELIYSVGDSGFAYIIFVQNAEGVFPELLAMCRA